MVARDELYRVYKPYLPIGHAVIKRTPSMTPPSTSYHQEVYTSFVS